MRSWYSLFGIGLLLLQSCESTKGWRGRVQAAAGSSRLTAKADGNKDSVDGTQQSVRLEAAKPVDYLPNVEVGLRFVGGATQIDEADDGNTYDLDTKSFAVAPAFRGYMPMGDTCRMFLDTFVGYEHFWGDETVVIDSVSYSGSGDQGGLYFGFGLGAEIDVSKNSSFLVGLEWSRMSTKTTDLDYYFDDTSLVVGWAHKF